MGNAWWPDPRSVAPDGGDEGFAALFESLHRAGPRTVPSRRDAARISRRSVGTFRRHFPRLAGMDWRAFLTVWRLECGRERLKNAFLLTKEVARDCGFLSEQGFSRAYRARFGEFPRRRSPGSE